MLFVDTVTMQVYSPTENLQIIPVFWNLMNALDHIGFCKPCFCSIFQLKLFHLHSFCFNLYFIREILSNVLYSWHPIIFIFYMSVPQFWRSHRFRSRIFLTVDAKLIRHYHCKKSLNNLTEILMVNWNTESVLSDIGYRYRLLWNPEPIINNDEEFCCIMKRSQLGMSIQSHD